MIREYLQQIGKTTVDIEIYAHIAKWAEWYKGKVKSFHSYSQFNGKRHIRRERATLGMAKKVCEDWANLLLNEKVEISAGAETNRLTKLLDQNNFRVCANQLVELAFALGTGAFVEYMDNGKVTIDYISAGMIYPLSWTNGIATECAFASERVVDGKRRIYLQLHTLENGRYMITNKLFDKDSMAEVPLPQAVKPVYVTGSETPLYQLITPNIVNNLDFNSPMGVSVFENAVDVLRGIDLVYDSYQNEFRLGKKRIIVPTGMAQMLQDSNGKSMPVFDDNDTEFYALKETDTFTQLKEINMEIRAEEHEKGLQRNLNLLSDKCGLGNDRYSFERSALKTATEVISEKSDLYQNLKKHEIILRKALCDLARAVLFLDGDTGDPEIQVSFDDSIIEDVNAIATRSMLELQSGIIDKVEYLMRVYKLTEEAARQKVAAAEAGMKETFDEHGDI